MYDTSPSVLKLKLGLIIIGYKSGEFCIFDISDEEFCIRTLAHKLAITGIDFSANFHIVTVSVDAFIKVWKYEQLKSQVFPLFKIKYSLITQIIGYISANY